MLPKAALANAPLSGTFYDPENDGTKMTSLGVHEHWNNFIDKKYSRNLGSDNGIELISSSPFHEIGRIDSTKYDKRISKPEDI